MGHAVDVAVAWDIDHLFPLPVAAGLQVAINLVQVPEVVSGEHGEHLAKGFLASFIVQPDAVEFFGGDATPELQVDISQAAKGGSEFTWRALVVFLFRDPTILIHGEYAGPFVGERCSRAIAVCPFGID